MNKIVMCVALLFVVGCQGLTIDGKLQSYEKEVTRIEKNLTYLSDRMKWDDRKFFHKERGLITLPDEYNPTGEEVFSFSGEALDINYSAKKLWDKIDSIEGNDRSSNIERIQSLYDRLVVVSHKAVSIYNRTKPRDHSYDFEFE